YLHHSQSRSSRVAEAARDLSRLERVFRRHKISHHLSGSESLMAPSASARHRRLFESLRQIRRLQRGNYLLQTAFHEAIEMIEREPDAMRSEERRVGKECSARRVAND